MMKVSSRSTYAIRALLSLSRLGGTATTPLARIAETQNIPLPYLEQIFAKLRKAGVVEAVRGPQGGYRLARPAAEITLAQIINSLEGPMEPVLCTIPENRTPDCHEVDGCLSRLLCSEIDGALNKVLSEKTLASLSGEAEKLGHSAPVTFKLQPRGA
jgi:Rrf2 family protein